jgi:hypothetical protein
MASLITSHATIGNSTLKDARDLTGSSLGGPEDFTLNLVDHLRRNKPSFKYTNEEQLTTSSFGGLEDFTADIVKYVNRTKNDDSSQRSKGRVIAPLRRASDRSVKTTRRSPSHSPSHSPMDSPNHRSVGLYPTGATKGDGESQSRRPSTPQSKITTPHILAKAHSSNKLVNETNNDLALDDNGTLSIIVRDGNVYHKKVRAGVRQKMQPTVSDDDEEEGEEEDLDNENLTESSTSSATNQHLPEPTMSLPLPLPEDEDDLTKPLGESTPTQHSLNSTTSSSTKDSPLEDAFDFATSLAHRIQRTPASANKPDAAAEYSINLSANASQLLADGVPRPATFPRNDSFVRDCSDPNVPFADRIRGIRPENAAGTTQPLPEGSKVDETELLRQKLEQMKAALAQKDETINALQTELSVKVAECEQLRNALQEKSTALTAAVESREVALQDGARAAQEKAAAKARETALQDALHAAEEQAAAAATTAAERFVIIKNALIAAEDEAAVAAERAQHALAAAESKADTRCRRLEKEANDLTASVRAARAEAKSARKEQAEHEAHWVQRSEILLAECDRRGRALMVKIGEAELPGVKDAKGRQAYRYQKDRERERERGRVDVVTR